MSMPTSEDEGEHGDIDNVDENGNGSQEILPSSFSLVDASGKRHPVWRYFKLYTDGNEKKAKCICTIGNGKTCLAPILRGWYTNNCMKHLKAHHQAAYEDCTGCQEVTKKKKVDSGKQQTLDDSIIFENSQLNIRNRKKSRNKWL